MRLRSLAPAKINLCLYLGPTRADGRHDLVTVFEALSLADELILETAPEGAPDTVICPGVDGENLALRALEALRARGWAGPPVTISIEKHIPIAAGMAGGSADAAATLRLAMAIAPGRPEELDAIAASLGSDVPSQLMPGVAIGTGAGDLVEPYPALAPHACAILPADGALPTADVFREADRLSLQRTAEELDDLYARVGAGLGAGARFPAALIVNDLEPAAISLCPAIAEALAAARDVGAAHTIVCGSGPTVAGIWWGEESEASARAAVELLRDRFPRAVAATPVMSDRVPPTML